MTQPVGTVIETPAPQRHEEREMTEVIRRLIEAFAERHGENVVRDTVERCHQTYATARVRAFVPLLVEREVRDRLGDPQRHRRGKAAQDPAQP